MFLLKTDHGLCARYRKPVLERKNIIIYFLFLRKLVGYPKLFATKPDLLGINPQRLL